MPRLNDNEIEALKHCVVLTPGLQATGWHRSTESCIETSLQSEDLIRIDAGQPVVIKTEDGSTVTLLDNVIRSCWWFPLQVPPRGTITLRSGASVSGPRPWLTPDRISTIFFSCDSAKNIVDHRKTLDALAGASDLSLNQRQILSLAAKGNTYSIHYQPTITALHPWPAKVEVGFTISLGTPIPIEDLLAEVQSILSFFSYCMLEIVRPQKLSISTRPFDELLASDEAVDERFVVNHSWPSDVHIGERSRLATPYSCWNDDEREKMCASLSVWLGRYNEWGFASRLMYQSFQYGGLISPMRLVTAFNWLEEIPTAKTVGAIREDDIIAIADAANQTAKKLGYDHLRHRIAGSIGNLKEESNRDRYHRLVLQSAGAYGSAIDLNTLVEDLVSAWKLRGTAAHKYFDSHGERVDDLYKAISAVELLCYLLTLRGLPSDDEVERRVARSPVIWHHWDASAQTSP